jgi:hypothetical protein
MSDSRKPRTDSIEPSELEQRLQMSKRSFVRLFLGSAAAYSVPLMASFSMEGLAVGKAHGQSAPPGQFLFQGPNLAPSLRSNFPQEKFPFLAQNQTLPADPPGLRPYHRKSFFPD